MPNLQLDNLRKITEAAIETAKRETGEKALGIFQRGLDHLKVEMLAGRTFAVVMSLKSGTDFDSSLIRNKKSLEPSQLAGTAARVFKLCEPFSPTLEYWSKIEGCQRDSYTVEGFNIVVHWTNADDLIARINGMGDKTLADSLKLAIQQAQSAVIDKAGAILNQLKAKALTQAAAGQDWAIVMSIKEGVDYHHPTGIAKSRTCKPEWLGPVAKAVWDACQNYKPELQYWSKTEGDQRDSYEVYGFNIVIHW
jgi:hypothetical protein